MQQTVIFIPSISARPLIFQPVYSVRSKFLSLKYQKCILFLGSKDIRIRKFEFVTKTQFLWIWTNHLYLSVLSTQSLRAKNERPTFRNPIEKCLQHFLEYIYICIITMPHIIRSHKNVAEIPFPMFLEESDIKLRIIAKYYCDN